MGKRYGGNNNNINKVKGGNKMRKLLIILIIAMILITALVGCQSGKIVKHSENFNFIIFEYKATYNCIFYGFTFIGSNGWLLEKTLINGVQVSSGTQLLLKGTKIQFFILKNGQSPTSIAIEIQNLDGISELITYNL